MLFLRGLDKKLTSEAIFLGCVKIGKPWNPHRIQIHRATKEDCSQMDGLCGEDG